MNIDKPMCRHNELKQICKWYSDGNCILNIADNVAPCEKVTTCHSNPKCKHEWVYIGLDEYMCAKCRARKYT